MKLILGLLILYICLILSFSTFETKLLQVRESLNSCKPIKHNITTFPWNYPGFKQYNNCYSYALNKPDITLIKKRYPGMSSNTKRNNNIYTCKYFDYLLKKDHPNIIKTNKFNQCPCDKPYKMISMVLSDGNTPYYGDNEDDFHFYRLDKNNKWSHKPGSKYVTYTDANDNIIHDPKKANHNYEINNKGTKNYNKFCGYYCIPK